MPILIYQSQIQLGISDQPNASTQNGAESVIFTWDMQHLKSISGRAEVP